jgi:hypothetical protein
LGAEKSNTHVKAYTAILIDIVMSQWFLNLSPNLADTAHPILGVLYT